MVEIHGLALTMKDDPNVIKLLHEMLAGSMSEVKPDLDLSSEVGYAYAKVESLLEISTQAAVEMLDFLAGEDDLEKRFHDRLLFCPFCQSLNLRPILCCPKCGSGNITKGRLLEHFSCANISLEEDYIAAGKYMCPKCKKELRFLGTDYRSLGVNYKCHNCGEVCTEVSLKWQCLKCLVHFAEGDTHEAIIHSYRINEAKRHLLTFELGPKAEFIEFLRRQGYTVIEKARVNGTSKSGAEHVLDILARRNDGLVTHVIGIGIAMNGAGEAVGLEEVFRFDDRAYDLGIHDKVLLVMPDLAPEAKQFAQRQGIKIFGDRDLELFLASEATALSREVTGGPFEFETKGKLIKYLEGLGYRVEENANIQGRSGAEHTFDILAYNDDRFIIHTLGIGVVAGKNIVGIDSVSIFDTKAYDAGIHDKVMLISPKLSQEASQFAQQQGIRIIEVEDASKLE